MTKAFLSKYRARLTEVDEIKFSSAKEAKYYKYLKILKRVGDVKEFQLQPRFELQPSFKYAGVTMRPIYYVADFLVEYTDGSRKVIDVKGYKTDVYKLKKKLFLYKYPDVIFEEV